jgi:hypothetical protein
MGAIQKSQSWPIAQSPTNNATPVLRAGLANPNCRLGRNDSGDNNREEPKDRDGHVRGDAVGIDLGIWLTERRNIAGDYRKLLANSPIPGLSRFRSTRMTPAQWLNPSSADRLSLAVSLLSRLRSSQTDA